MTVAGRTDVVRCLFEKEWVSGERDLEGIKDGPRGCRGGVAAGKGERGSETEEVAIVGSSGGREGDAGLGNKGMKLAQSGPDCPRNKKARERKVQPPQDRGTFETQNEA